MEPSVSLGATAYWTASVRAMESARGDRLFYDPWAAALAGEQGAAWIAGRTDLGVVPIALRTRFFDDWLQRVVAEDALQQVVLLAAGLDTRAYRLVWPEGTHIYEVDQPAVLEHKAQVLTDAGAQLKCERTAIAADLAGDWEGKLAASGFRAQAPAAWLLEGFLFYLSNEQLRRILDQVADLAAPGSWMGFDIVNSVMLTHPLTQSWVQMQARSGAPWIGTLDDPVGYLAARGWQATLTQAGEPDVNYGRWSYPVFPVGAAELPHNWLVTAQKEVRAGKIGTPGRVQ
ncbi:MAG: SAM-dependent methyltransferase [Anaerolineae bacterium]